VSDEFHAVGARAFNGTSAWLVDVNEDIALFVPTVADFVLTRNSIPEPAFSGVLNPSVRLIRCVGNSVNNFDLFRLVYTPTSSDIRTAAGKVLAPFDLLVVVT
jgi:hypothetical protein